jgi:hypothetical protein
MYAARRDGRAGTMEGALPQERKIDPSALPPRSPGAAPAACLASKVLMVRPTRFGFNEETAADNAFQKKGRGDVQKRALTEFDIFVGMLRADGVGVVVVEDTKEPHTPDSIFPNNWFSTHATGELVFYPMCHPNRRLERKEAPLRAIRALGDKGGMKKILVLSDWEGRGRFLEGTGSMVLDRANRVAFVCRSPRSDEEVLEVFCRELDYTYYCFDAMDKAGSPVYHTNVVMCVGDGFAVVCLEAVWDAGQREGLAEILGKLGKEVIDISLDQMGKYAGNMLQLKNAAGEGVLVMSAAAEKALTEPQLAKLRARCRIVAPDIHTIEAVGGGSARCMLAEMFF